MLSPTASPKLLLTFLKRSMSMNITVGRFICPSRARVIAPCRRSRNSSRLGKLVRLSCTASCISRSCERLRLVTSRISPTQRKSRILSLGAALVPQIAAVLSLHAELGLQLAALVFLQRPQHQAEALAVGGMHVLEEAVDGGVEGAWWCAERFLDLLSDGDLILGGVPLPDGGARAIDGERLHLYLADRPELERAAAGGAEGKLRRGEAEQRQDKDEASGENCHHDVA